MITHENNIKNYLTNFKTVFWDFDGVIKDSVLIKGEAYPPYKDGLPVFSELKNKLVPKRLKSKFMV